MTGSALLAVVTGITLAAACGLRAFLPLLAVGFAARFGLIRLGSAFDWLAGNPALIALGVATVIEIAADKIPIVDHALDVAGTLLRPAAAVIAVLGVAPHLPAGLAALLALAAGAGALGVHAVKAKARIGSTALTLGHLNPLLSFAEDGTVILVVAAAVLVPIFALAVMATILVVLWRRRTRGGRAMEPRA